MRNMCSSESPIERLQPTSIICGLQVAPEGVITHFHNILWIAPACSWASFPGVRESPPEEKERDEGARSGRLPACWKLSTVVVSELGPEDT